MDNEKKACSTIKNTTPLYYIHISSINIPIVHYIPNFLYIHAHIHTSTRLKIRVIYI